MTLTTHVIGIYRYPKRKGSIMTPFLYFMLTISFELLKYKRASRKEARRS